MFRYLLVPCLFLMIAGCQPGETPESQPIPVSRLIKDYEDIAQGDKLYKGKEIVIRGRMLGSGLSDAAMAEEWGIPENVYFLTLAESDDIAVVCLFADDPAVGGWATIRGRCKGAKLAGRPILENCSVVR